MKNRRYLVHALLALLLVLSQQLGAMHAVSHWSGYPHTAESRQGIDASSDAGRNAGLALDHQCSQCLAFAQLASAIASPSYSFPTIDYAAPRATLVPALPAGRPAARAYDSRAPPLA